FVKINGKLCYLWRAVDQHGNVLDVLVQSRRNAKAAKRFFRKLLKGLQYVPRVLVTDKLASYGVAHRQFMPSDPPAVAVSQQPRRELSSAHPTTRTGDETFHIGAACSTVPVCLQWHLGTFSAATAPAQRNPSRVESWRGDEDRR
ncbi:MAG TPA: DDE-type integrase/transposase/recombinase, partial [Pseudonocardiaceae bacterium]|nr:DDE-type integrase/transposase/recombinase [Pseudonocardiaceae bacterium]